MSQLLIHDYLAQLDLIKKVSGSQRETIVREAFKDLLKAWGRQQGLVFLAEYPLKTATRTNIAVDGALLHELRMPLGYWEAKDADDDLDAEVGKKFRKGYPQDNIIFSDDTLAVLWQNRQEVMRCDMADTEALSRLLKLFFSFERPEIAGFRAAVEQFKADLPAVLDALRDMIALEHANNPSFRAAAAQIASHSEKQTFLKVIYENFYKVYNAKAADRLGVVYTPNEIVRFMIDGADWLCEQPYALTRVETPDARARAAGLHPKALLKSDPASGSITLDTETTLRGIPRSLVLQTRQPLCPRLGARSAQGKKAQRPDPPRALRHLPLCRLQGAGHRPAGPRDHGERADAAHRAGHAGGAAVSLRACVRPPAYCAYRLKKVRAATVQNGRSSVW